jgi:hypothetical protein
VSFFDRFRKKKDDSGKSRKPADMKNKNADCRDAEWATCIERPAEDNYDEVKTNEEKKEEVKPMAAKKDGKVWHITKREDDGVWQVKAEGASKATKLFKTKAEAEEYVKTLKANNEGSRVVKHKKTGEFQKK